MQLVSRARSSSPTASPGSIYSSSQCTTPATSYFDSPTVPRSAAKDAFAISPSPTLAYHSSSGIELFGNLNSDPTNSVDQEDSSPKMPTTTTTSISDIMSGVAPNDTFYFAGELKLGGIIASGQWSKVYGASLVESTFVAPSHDPIRHVDRASEAVRTRPERLNIDRTTTSTGRKVNELFAAKIASGKTAIKVLQSEAKMLTFISERRFMREHVVEFFGSETQNRALVMENSPVTMEDFATSIQMGQMFDETSHVMRNIQEMSRHLIKGLEYLHSEKIIHGDIKPSNILLRQKRRSRDSGIGGLEKQPISNRNQSSELVAGRNTMNFDLQPIYCDFSASRFDHPESIPNESAGTYDFMAPELFSRSKPGNYTTFASDVYALGITLLYTILGKSPYEGAQNVFMQRAMAMAGTPLDFISMDNESVLRWEKAKFGPWIAKAIKAKASERCSAREWRDLVEERWDGGK